MSVFGVIAGATTAALAAAVLWAPSAQAERHVGSDPTGDMVTETAGGVVVAAEKHHNLDIREVAVRYRPHRLTIRVKFYKLRSPEHGGLGGALRGFIRTNSRAMPYSNPKNGPWQWEVSFAGRNSTIGILDALNEEIWICFDGGTRVEHGAIRQGMRANINYRQNFILVSYPRRCIDSFRGADGRPRWVRVSVASQAPGFFFDHWIKPNNITFPDWHQAFYPTPRLYRGMRAAQ